MAEQHDAELQVFLAIQLRGYKEDARLQQHVFGRTSTQDCCCSLANSQMQHWPNAWVPGAKNDFKGQVTIDTELPREATWWVSMHIIELCVGRERMGLL